VSEHTRGKAQMSKEFWLQRWKGLDHLEDPGVDRHLKLQWILREVSQPVRVKTLITGVLVIP